MWDFLPSRLAKVRFQPSTIEFTLILFFVLNPWTMTYLHNTLWSSVWSNSSLSLSFSIHILTLPKSSIGVEFYNFENWFISVALYALMEYLYQVAY